MTTPLKIESEVKFTPGPWKRGYGAITASTTDQVGDPIIIALPYGTSKRIGLKGVAEYSTPQQDTADANARLIAAAPDGYALAEEVVNHLYTLQDIARVRQIAKDFLAKAVAA